jgi:hypothetical protein
VERQKARVSRAGADKPDPARLERRQVRRRTQGIPRERQSSRRIGHTDLFTPQHVFFQIEHFLLLFSFTMNSRGFG